MEHLEAIEVEVLARIVQDPTCSMALQKFCDNHVIYYTQQSRNSLNIVPKDLHEQMRHLEQAKQYAAMAKAWGTMWAELEKASGK